MVHKFSKVDNFTYIYIYIYKSLYITYFSKTKYIFDIDVKNIVLLIIKYSWFDIRYCFYPISHKGSSRIRDKSYTLSELLDGFCFNFSVHLPTITNLSYISIFYSIGVLNITVSETQFLSSARKSVILYSLYIKTPCHDVCPL